MERNYNQVIKNFKIRIFDYKIIVNDLDNGTYTHLESTIIYKKKKRKIKVYDLGDTFNVFPIRELTFSGTLYDGGLKSPLTLTDTIAITDR